MVTTEAKCINLEELWSRIAIRPPYFAIDRLTLDPCGILSASVPVQHDMGQEAGGISAAEVGRHLAVLGLCSVALQKLPDQKHYYLAQRAHLTRRGTIHELDSSKGYLGLAWPIAIEKRSAIARTQLWDRNQRAVLYDLTVRYALIDERLFERLFHRYRQLEGYECSEDFNPYAKSLPLKHVKIIGRRLTAVLSVESPQQCSGHFPHFPAIPVAILMHALAEASGILTLAQLELPEFTYVVSDAEVHAENLAFTDEEVDIVVDYLHRLDQVHILSCRARTRSQKDVGQMEITLEHCALPARVGEDSSSLTKAVVPHS